MRHDLARPEAVQAVRLSGATPTADRSCRDHRASHTIAAVSETPKRRWYQFSLRSLLIAVTLLCVVCGYIGWQAKIVKQRRYEIEARSSPRFVVYRGKRTLPNGPNWLRLALGDMPVQWISSRNAANADMLRTLFPEAIVDGPRPAFDLSALK